MKNQNDKKKEKIKRLLSDIRNLAEKLHIIGFNPSQSKNADINSSEEELSSIKASLEEIDEVEQKASSEISCILKI